MTTEGTSTPPAAPAPRQLTRSTSDRVLGGVCGGLGRYFGIDAVIFRVLLIVLVFVGGAGFLAYLVAWWLVPADDKPADAATRKRMLRRVGIAALVAAATVTLGAAGAVLAATGGGTAVAIGVIAAGAMLLAGGLIGRARWLIAPALALALSAGLVSAANVDARGGIGERIYRPASAGDLRPSYKLGVGHLVLDLRDTQLTPGDHPVKLDLGVGGAEVLVPDGVCVATKAHMGIGGTQIFRRDSGGVDADWQDARSAPAGVPRVVVNADVGIGGLRVQPTEHGSSGGNGACSRG